MKGGRATGAVDDEGCGSSVSQRAPAAQLTKRALALILANIGAISSHREKRRRVRDCHVCGAHLQGGEEAHVVRVRVVQLVHPAVQQPRVRRTVRGVEETYGVFRPQLSGGGSGRVLDAHVEKPSKTSSKRKRRHASVAHHATHAAARPKVDDPKGETAAAEAAAAWLKGGANRRAPSADEEVCPGAIKAACIHLSQADPRGCQSNELIASGRKLAYDGVPEALCSGSGRALGLVWASCLGVPSRSGPAAEVGGAK